MACCRRTVWCSGPCFQVRDKIDDGLDRRFARLDQFLELRPDFFYQLCLAADTLLSFSMALSRSGQAARALNSICRPAAVAARWQTETRPDQDRRRRWLSTMSSESQQKAGLMIQERRIALTRPATVILARRGRSRDVRHPAKG